MLALVTGGAASGKSEYAEQLAVRLGSASGGELLYLAAMIPYGEEAEQRIQRHRAARKEKGFSTIERYLGLKDCRIPEGAIVLLECMSNLLANEMYESGGAGKNAVEEILSGVDAALCRAAHLVIVTNTVDADGAEYGASALDYLKKLAVLNRRLAEKADFAAEVVCAFPLVFKGAEPKEGKTP